jgi:putative ABC transport system permease protein
MQLVGLLPLAFKRLRSRPWLTLLLVLTTALIIGFTGSIPVFANAVSRKILQDEIDVRSHTKGWPIFSVRVSSKPDARTPMGVPESLATRGWVGDMLRYWTALPLVSTYVELQSPMYRLAPRSGSSAYKSQYLAGVRVVHVPDVENYLQVTEGASYGQISDPLQLHVWLESSFAARLALHVGDALELGDLYSTSSRGLPIIVAGFWEADPASAVGGIGQQFWYRPAPTHFDGSLLVTADQFQQFVSAKLERGADHLFWYYVFDDRWLNFSFTDRYIGGLRLVAREVERRLPGGGMDFNPSEDLIRGRLRETSLLLILLGFSLPVLIIMISFLASLSATQTRFQESEMAIMVSRGATRGQMLAVAALESLFIVLAAIPPGLVLALGLAYILGFADGFLAFAAREPLQVSVYSLNRSVVVAVAGVSLIIRLVSTWRASGMSLVMQERQRARPAALLTGARLMFLAIMLLTTLYAYRVLSGRGSLALASLSLLDPRHDPLLLLAPSLFIFTAPLVVSELFVWLVRPADLLGRFVPWVSVYLASANLARAGSRFRAPIYRLVLCLTLGVFYASVARSADIWQADLLRHGYGADLTFRIGPETDGLASFGLAAEQATEIPLVPDDDYRAIPGVREATRLGDFRATIVGARDLPYCRLLAIERDILPKVAYFRDDYASTSFGDLANRLARVPNGILLPHPVAAHLMLSEGDRLRVNLNLFRDVQTMLDYQVVGFFDNFPTMYPQQAPVLVTNLSHLELNTSGVLPHSIWMKLDPQADPKAVVDDVRRLHVVPRDIKDLREAFATERRRLERTGAFGVLTVCFLAGAILSIADLFLHSTYMLHERTMTHAVLCALGFDRGSILNGVVLEELASVAYSLAAGIGCGVLAAILYVPFYPLANMSGPPVPPFQAFVDWQRTDWMAAAVAGALCLAEMLVLLRMSRALVFEVLRMGAHV